MWLFLAVANVSTWKVTKGKLIYFIHIAMANDFMYGVPPRHTHGENRVKMVLNGCSYGNIEAHENGQMFQIPL